MPTLTCPMAAEAFEDAPETAETADAADTVQETGEAEKTAAGV